MQCLSRAGRYELNERHMVDPQVGDYWHEMLVPYLVVVGRIGHRTIVCETTKCVGGSKWTWDLDHLRIVTEEWLRQRLMYRNLDGFVAWVEPRAHEWVAGLLGEKGGQS